VKFRDEGLSLWYGTPDAPAPLDDIVSRKEACVVVGVYPANPTNAVHVRYRVDGGIVQSAPGRELRIDYAKETQYYLVTFPPFVTGDVVEYCPVFKSAGRQVPSPAMAERFPSKFLLAPKEGLRSEPRATPSQLRSQKLASELDFIAHVTIRVDEPLLIGATPEGVRIDFFALGGDVVGPKLSGHVVARSSDHLFVRPDGVGMIRVRAIIATNDGALLEVEDTGSLDFGVDGYERAVANALPSQTDLVIAPRILTAYPKYQWLNRVQCLGIGMTHLDKLTVEYDLFAVGCRDLAKSS
jgi:hypothetical protein